MRQLKCPYFACSDVTVLILDRPRHEKMIAECRAAGARIRLISDGDVGGAIETAKVGAPVDVMLGIGGALHMVLLFHDDVLHCAASFLGSQAARLAELRGLRAVCWALCSSHEVPELNTCLKQDKKKLGAGTPEGVIAAAALKCMGGSLQGKLYPRNDEERDAAVQQGYDLQQILTTDDLCRGNDVFFAATGVSDGDLLQGVRFFSGGASSHSIVMRSKSSTIRTIETQHRWSKPSITNMDGL